MRGFQRERHAGPRHEHEEETPDQAAADVEGRLASGIAPGVAGRPGRVSAGEVSKAMEDIQGGNSVLPPDAQNYVYVLGPGLMCNIYPYLGAKYMEEIEAQLKGKGLDVRVLRKMNSVASVKA